MTEIFVENNRIDISADISALLTFALDDVKDFSSRQTTFSKTIVLPGTANNNRLFGHIFQFGSNNDYDAAQANIGYNFNAAKSAACIIFQNNLQTFQGSLRMLTITVDGGKIEYEVAMFGNLSQLNVALSPNSKAGTGLLENLDFSEYDHAYTAGNIISSWGNDTGAGYFYPLIDYGNYSCATQFKANSSFVQKHDWTIGTFRPALFVKEYIDKMFKAAGFTYDSPFFNSAHFKRLIIPHNQKVLQKLASNLLTATVLNTDPVVTVLNSSTKERPLIFKNITSPGPVFTHSAGVFTYSHSGPATNANITFSVSGHRTNTVTHFALDIRHNGTPIAGQGINIGNVPGASNLPFHWFNNGALTIALAPDDTIDLYFNATLSSSDTSYSLNVDEASLTVSTQTPQPVAVGNGDDVQINYAIPRNIKQIDFLVSIIKLFNLYVVEDKFNPRLLHIKPFADGTDKTENIPGFFLADSSNAVDWTYKLNHNKPITIKPMSELTSKVYNFNYKEDSDYFNDLYNKRYNQTYGSYKFDTEYEFSTDETTLELIFAGTPIVGYKAKDANLDKVYSTIFKRTGDDASPTEEQTDCVIRILQSKHLTDVNAWKLYNSNATTVLQAGIESYGYAGHINNPDVPASDINFGALNELFFALATGALNVTQFNVYWSGYMAEITDKDSKLVTASFYLTPADIYNLDFSKYIQLNGALFRLNKITDYNASTPGDCQVELIRVLNTTYNL